MGGRTAEVLTLIEQIYRRARAQYGDHGGEMLPIRLLEDLTSTVSGSRRSDQRSPSAAAAVR